MKNNTRLWGSSLTLALVLAACGSNPSQRTPDLSTLSQGKDRKKPESAKLPIVLSDPIAPDPEKALRNYRSLLELDPDPDLKAEVMRRVADLQVQVDDVKGGDENSITNLKSAIAVYEQLLTDKPEDPNNDRLLYQLARAYSNANDGNRAAEALGRLLKQYPNSNLAGDAHFRRAEILFRLNRYAEAEFEYKTVLDQAVKSPFFEPAQYKYAWSLFKQNKIDEALPVFFAILDRELPPGEVVDSQQAFSRTKADLAKDSLRVTSLAFASQNGGASLNEYLAKKGEPRFYPLLYRALGEFFDDKRRYSEAAESYAAFIVRHAQHPLAPNFQQAVIEAYNKGGFIEDVVREKERYATTYDPRNGYWQGKPASAEVLLALRSHLEDLGQFYRKRGQDRRADKDASLQASSGQDFATAAGWYKKVLDLYPADPQKTGIHFLMAESLEEAGNYAAAKAEYETVAYTYAAHSQSAEAAYASVLMSQKLLESSPPANKASAVQVRVAAGRRFAEAFPAHPERSKVITRGAQELYKLPDLQAALVEAQFALKDDKLAADLKRTNLEIIADSYFDLKQYREAESGYSTLLALMPDKDPDRAEAIDRLANSVYQQAETARVAGNIADAVVGFLKVGKVAPTSVLRVSADYAAGSALFNASQFLEAIPVLEDFRQRYPTQDSAADVDRKLAVAYEKTNQYEKAASSWQRVIDRKDEKPEVRRDALFLVAKLYDQAGQAQKAARAYEFYVGSNPFPLETALKAQRRIADLYLGLKDEYRYLFWLRELVTAEDNGGSQRNEASKGLAAQAAMDVATLTVASANALKITLPIEESLPEKKGAVEAAIQSLDKASSYGVASTSTAATYQLGELYRAFAKSLLESERPTNLKGEELDEYNLLLEEQASPFEEKAIEAHEVNLKRMGQGLFDPNITASGKALELLAPGKYGQRELLEDRYESLQ
jgi:tetratricopeptide (TPR) repeat protein